MMIGVKSKGYILKNVFTTNTILLYHTINFSMAVCHIAAGWHGRAVIQAATPEDDK